MFKVASGRMDLVSTLTEVNLTNYALVKNVANLRDKAQGV